MRRAASKADSGPKSISAPETLIGQAQAETMLARAVQHRRVGHAYLFLGASGCGKSRAGILFAQAMNCAVQPAARAEGERWRLAPCGACESCRRIAAGTHPEVITVHPGSKTGQNISIDQAREIRANASLRPKLGNRRIYLIPRAETFSEEAANALLKTLEEPSDSITLILGAPNPTQVLPTIRSRCQSVRFGLSSAADVTSALEGLGVEQSVAAALGRACGGRPGVAFGWASAPAVLQHREALLDAVREVLLLRERAAAKPALAGMSFRLGARLAALTATDTDERNGDMKRPAKAVHKENLQTVLGYLRDVLLITLGGDPDLVQNLDRLKDIARHAEATDVHSALANVDVVRQSQELLDRNVGASLVIERLVWALVAGRVG